MSALLLALLLTLALIVAANMVAKSQNPQAYRLYTWLLLLLSALSVVGGIGVILLPAQSLPSTADLVLNPEDVDSVGYVLIGIGIWGVISCFSSFRTLLSHLLPLDAESPVHMTAVAMSGLLVGNSALALSQDFLSQISSTGLTVSIMEVVLQQNFFVMVALLGTGLFVRRDFPEALQRLGIVKPTLPQFVVASGVIVLLIMVQTTIGAIWALLDPQQAELLGSANQVLLSGFDSVGEWLVLAFATGIGEELLFRGALQPVFGLPITSLLFAIVHIQYGITPISIVVFLFGIVLGLVRRYANTTIAIFVHFGYNFALGLLSLLALYLQQFVTG